MPVQKVLGERVAPVAKFLAVPLRWSAVHLPVTPVWVKMGNCCLCE